MLKIHIGYKCFLLLCAGLQLPMLAEISQAMQMFVHESRSGELAMIKLQLTVMQNLWHVLLGVGHRDLPCLKEI